MLWPQVHQEYFCPACTSVAKASGQSFCVVDSVIACSIDFEYFSLYMKYITERSPMASSLRVVEIFTDGACLGNPGPGGWAALLQLDGHEKSLSGGAVLTTNNRMEMTAALEALRALKRPTHVHLHTDSTYLKDGITNWVHNWQKRGWKTADNKPVKNQDLWMALLEALAPHTVTWFWVKAHNGHAQNEYVDGLARAEALKYKG